MKFIIGKKLNMTQVFDKNGVAHPATVLETAPAVVTQVKTTAKDGYEAVQIASGAQKPQRLSKPVRGHFKNLGAFKNVKEFRMANPTLNVGDKVDLSQFVEGDFVTVSGISKGKGFQGVVKRHGFGGGPRTHGQKHSEREPGSIGGGLRNKVPKAMRMAGRMGADRITVKNLKVLYVDTNANLLYVAGAVPGRRGTVLEVVSK
jgi:large subunit ribosomal protein L3